MLAHTHTDTHAAVRLQRAISHCGERVLRVPNTFLFRGNLSRDNSERRYLVVLTYLYCKYTLEKDRRNSKISHMECLFKYSNCFSVERSENLYGTVRI